MKGEADYPFIGRLGLRPPHSKPRELVRRLVSRPAVRQFDRRLADVNRRREFEEHLADGGYVPFQMRLPPGDRPIEAARLEWSEPHFIQLDQQDRTFDVVGLWWREP